MSVTSYYLGQEIDRLKTVNRQHVQEIDRLETVNRQHVSDRAQILSTNEVLQEQVEDSERDIRELMARLASQKLEAKLTMEKFKIQFNPC